MDSSMASPLERLAISPQCGFATHAEGGNNLTVDQQRKKLELTAIYPELFPYFRFQVFAGNLGLQRHQHPFEGQLCLIGRSTWNWHTHDTLASYITHPSRLQALLVSGRSPDRASVSHLEEPQAEPFGAYYHYAPESIVLVGSGLAAALARGVVRRGHHSYNGSRSRLR
jgi:hypothetical protein